MKVRLKKIITTLTGVLHDLLCNGSDEPGVCKARIALKITAVVEGVLRAAYPAFAPLDEFSASPVQRREVAAEVTEWAMRVSLTFHLEKIEER